MSLSNRLSQFTTPIMTRSLFFVFSALFLLTVRAEAGKDASDSGDVVVATKDNFEDIISGDHLTLVKFFAPWCGHCKKMAPDFKEAATELKGKATLVDVDATVEKSLAEKYGIRGFPTLKLFSNGELLSDYKGSRTKEDIVKYIERSMLPSFVELSDADSVSQFVKDNKGKTMVFGSTLDKLTTNFKKLSMSLRDNMPDSIAFASVPDGTYLKDLAKDNLVPDSVFLSRDDGTSETFTGEADGLESWLQVAALPLFAELSRNNAGMYTELDKPILMLFQDPEKKDEEVNKIMKEVASASRKEGVPFTWINSVELKSFAEHLGVADKTPALAVYEFKSDTKYVFNEEFNKENLSAWVSKIAKGEISATMKSEAIPETNDEPVKVVVGDSWKEIVQDESKDVLIEQYAPWCGHCKQLEPIYNELATKLGDVKTLVIAKMDATKNDAPKEYKAQGFPTLHFFPAGSTEGKPYEGGRTLKDFVKFLQENATHKEGIEVGEEEKEDTKEEEEKEEL